MRVQLWIVAVEDSCDRPQLVAAVYDVKGSFTWMDYCG
jgi:hypothetical protein